MSKMAMRKKKSKNLEVRWSWKLGRAVDGGLALDSWLSELDPH